MFGGNFAPRSWALCDGQLLPINSNQALFSLLGTTFGGDGRTTFQLPGLRGRVPVHAGAGPGLTDRRLGARGGAETTTLTTANLPSHGHGVPSLAVSGSITIGVNEEGQNSSNPTSGTFTETTIYNSGAPDGAYGHVSSSLTTAAGNTHNTGNNIAFNNMQPWLAVNYLICLRGTFPSRN